MSPRCLSNALWKISLATSTKYAPASSGFTAKNSSLHSLPHPFSAFVADGSFVTLYRRAILDYWAENDETLGSIVTHVLIHEIGHHFGLSDDDMEKIEEGADQ